MEVLWEDLQIRHATAQDNSNENNNGGHPSADYWVEVLKAQFGGYSADDNRPQGDRIT